MYKKNFITNSKYNICDWKNMSNNKLLYKEYSNLYIKIELYFESYHSYIIINGVFICRITICAFWMSLLLWVENILGFVY